MLSLNRGSYYFFGLSYSALTLFRIGKGFQGPMKRWNFRGLKASHGVSISHRSGGSMGQHQVWFTQRKYLRVGDVHAHYLGPWADLAWQEDGRSIGG
jgi:hypothetical protein